MLAPSYKYNLFFGRERRERRKIRKKSRYRVYRSWQLTSESFRPRHLWVSLSWVSDYVNWKWFEKKKPGGSKCSAKVWNHRKRIWSSLRHRADVRGQLGLGVGKKSWGGKDRQLNTSQEDVRIDEKLQAPIFGWAPKRGHTPDANLWK